MGKEAGRASEYVGLHLHTDMGSLMDGVATTKEYADRAADIGMKALACTDHGSLAAHRSFVREMRAVGVKPILGVEAYFTKDRFDTRDKKDRTDPLDVVYNHLVILAKNDQGLENLGRLNEIAWTEGFYKKPRIDYEVLDKYGDGLIITSACMSGLLNKAIEADDYAAAKTQIEWFRDRFGDDFYVEVMPHNVAGMNAKLLDLADSMGVKSVVTPDCHHSHVEQKVIQEAMLLLNTHAKLRKDADFKKSQKIENMMERFDYLYGDDRMMTFRHFDIHLLSGDEMWEAMAKDGIEREDIFANTLAIADSVEEYDIKENLNLLPAQYRDPDAQLEKLSLAGLKNRGVESQEYMDRLNEELQIIKDKQFAPYFLVVKNMLGWAKKQGIMVGPGRGSSAGSLICYALGITDIDPIEHGLLFFRFIDPSRDDWPDIDSDIQDTRREEVKDYLVRQYRHVASIATFLQFKDKGVVRDVARVLNVPLPDVNKALKYVDTWEEFVSSRQTQDFRTRYPEVVEIAEQLRGRIRGTGIHAAGVVTAKEPISKIAPMETRNVPGQKERMPVVAVDMDEAARIGLIKIDALGLKTLSVIAETLKTIESRHPKPVKLEDIPMDDRFVYQMLSDGHTKGVFQCMRPDQPIHISNGVKPAGDIVVGDRVLTHMGRFKAVVNTMRRNSTDDMYEIVPAKQNGVSLSVTGEHPILVSDSKFNMRWEKASQIVGGRKSPNRSTDNWWNYVVVPKTARGDVVFFGKTEVDEEFARFLGLYVAEGCVSDDGRLTFTFHKNEDSYINFVVGVLRKEFGVAPKVHIRGNTAYVRVGMNKHVDLFRGWFGHGAKNKFVPSVLFGASVEVVRGFLTGYAWGDGAISKSGHVTVQTASQNLAWGLKALSVNLGSYSNVRHHRRQIDGYGTYDVYTCSYHLGTRKTKRVLENEDYLLIPIREVNKYEHHGEVVNFEVADDNSYVSDFVLHNCEAAPYTNLLVKMGVDNFNDLAASNALVRPGAMNTIGKEYIARKRGRAVTTYIHPIMKKYTEETYGEIIYQEQVMLACVELGGMTMAEANKVRKIIGKKKDVKEFEAYKNKFVSGASKHIGQKEAEHLWKDFEAHAGYSFNKSHAVAYSTLSYWTAWLKHHYPLEFVYALLKNEGDKDTRTEYLIEAKRLGIPMKLPHINESDVEFKIEGNGIRFGLSAVKFISETTAKRYIERRPFNSKAEVEEFTYTKGSGVNSRALSAMNAIGALAFSDNPVSQEEVRKNLYEFLNLPEFNHDVPAHYHAFVTDTADYEERGAFILLGMVRNIKRGKGWSRVELLYKTGTVGIFDKERTEIEQGKMYLLLVGDNRIIEAIPADNIKNSKSGVVKFMNYKTLPFGDSEYFVVAFQGRTTKAGKKMATLVLANNDRDLASVVVFPNQYGEAFIKLNEGEHYQLVLGETRDGGISYKGVISA